MAAIPKIHRRRLSNLEICLLLRSWEALTFFPTTIRTRQRKSEKKKIRGKKSLLIDIQFRLCTMNKQAVIAIAKKMQCFFMLFISDLGWSFFLFIYTLQVTNNIHFIFSPCCSVNHLIKRLAQTILCLSCCHSRNACRFMFIWKRWRHREKASEEK